MLCTISSGLGGLWTFYDPFLIKADQPENLFSLKVFLLYFAQPQKVLNRVTFRPASESAKQSYILTEQRCSGSQQRKNQLAQRSDMVNSKADTYFFLHSNYVNQCIPRFTMDKGYGHLAASIGPIMKPFISTIYSNNFSSLKGLYAH